MRQWTSIACPVCGRDACQNPQHIPPDLDEVYADTAPPVGTPRGTPASDGLDPDGLESVSTVVAEGQRLAREGIRYRVHGIIPAYGMVGMLTAKAKVGKTTFAYQLGAAVARGMPFLDRDTTPARVLVIAAEDPPEYTAWLARHLGDVPDAMMTFWRRPVRFTKDGLTAIAQTVERGHYGLVLVASWQAVVCELVEHENDNAGLARIVEHVKQFARPTKIPWLIDSHAGKGEDQSDDADPTLAMRGASSAAGAADFSLSLRYVDSPFKPRRKLSGKGRFVDFAPLLLDCDLDRQHYIVVGDTKSVTAETTWRLIDTIAGALTDTLQSTYAIAQAIHPLGPKSRPTTSQRRDVREALHGRAGVRAVTETKGDQTVTRYARASQPDVAEV